MDLNGLNIFVHVVKYGSFSGAAKRLKMPASTISRKLSMLEDSLGFRLLERSTRKLRLTESGRTLFDYAERGLQELGNGLLALQEGQDRLKGTLRLSMPPNFAPWRPLLTEFKKTFPDIEICILTSPQKLDLIVEQIDVTLRIGEVDSQSFIARNVGSYSHKLVASPQYLKEISLPILLADITKYKCFGWGDLAQDVYWELKDQHILLPSKAMCNDYALLKHMVLQHQGITELPPFFCNKEIQAGQLISVLEEYPMKVQQVHLVYPSRKQLSRIARTFIEFSIDYCRENPDLYSCSG